MKVGVQSTIAYLALGSNLGARYVLLHRAIDKIAEEVGIIVAIAPFYETSPWGFVSENQFLNTVVAIRTLLSPEELLIQTQTIERLLGRTNKHLIGETYADRTIDIDILFYGQEIIAQGGYLQIPHPLLHERLFVLQPLVQIAPSLVHPQKGKSIEILLSELL